MSNGEPVLVVGWHESWDFRVRELIETELRRFKAIPIGENKPIKKEMDIKEGSSLTAPSDEEMDKRCQVPVIVLVELIAQAIATFEGFYRQKSEPSAAQRFNNPGNLRSWGKVPIGYVTGGGAGFANFPTVQEGWRALRLQVWKNVVDRGMTLVTFFERYAPSSDNNRPVQYAEFIHQYLADRGIDLPINAVILDIGANIQDRGAFHKSKIGYPGLFDVPSGQQEYT